MKPSRRLLALVCALVTLAVPAAVATPALAAGNAIINDCQSNGQLTHPYTVKQLRHALAVMPATVKQYTSCFDVVQSALVSARKHGGTAPAGSGGGSSSFLPTWLIIVIVVVLLAAVTFGAMAIRRRRSGGDGFDPPQDSDGPDGPRGPGGTRPISPGGGEARTRVMPSVPAPEGPESPDTAQTRPMPSVPDAEDPARRPPASTSRATASGPSGGAGPAGPGRPASTLRFMPSERQVMVGAVPVGGGAPVAVQTMTKTETADLAATMAQIRRVAEAGADIVRVAVPRDKDVEALQTIVRESPIPIIADIHFNHTLAIKAIDAGAHCVRLNPGNIGGPDKVAEVIARAKERGTPLRVGVNSGSLPAHLRQLEYDNPVEALVTAAVETVELMERLDFQNFKVSMKSTSVPNTIASNRLLAQRIPYPLHLGVTEAGTKWSGSLKSAVGLGTLLADGIGDTIRISLSTFHAEEEVKVAWEILKALKLRERGPVLIACPTCGRLQFDMDSVVAEVERRLEDYEDADRGLRARLRRQRDRRGPPCRLRHHRRQGQGDDLLQGRADRAGPHRGPRRQAIRGDRQVLRRRQDRPPRRARRRRGPRLAGRERGRHRDDARAAGGHGDGRGRARQRALDETASPVAGRRFTRV